MPIMIVNRNIFTPFPSFVLHFFVLKFDLNIYLGKRRHSFPFSFFVFILMCQPLHFTYNVPPSWLVGHFNGLHINRWPNSATTTATVSHSNAKHPSIGCQMPICKYTCMLYYYNGDLLRLFCSVYQPTECMRVYEGACVSLDAMRDV